MKITKQNWASITGLFSGFLVYLVTQVLPANGNVFPHDWQSGAKLVLAAAIGFGIHQAAQTSAGHPNGAGTIGISPQMEQAVKDAVAAHLGVKTPEPQNK